MPSCEGASNYSNAYCRGRWSNFVDEKYFKELARGAGKEYIKTEVLVCKGGVLKNFYAHHWGYIGELGIKRSWLIGELRIWCHRHVHHV
jgi:hypothetical protein